MIEAGLANSAFTDKQKRHPWRPRIFVAERRQRCLDALRTGNSRRASCAAAGISEDTFALTCRRDPEFLDQVLEAEGEAERLVTAQVLKAMPDTWTAAAWWLERRRPDDYARKETQQVYLQVGRELAQLSDEQLLALATGGVVPNGSGEVIDVEATVEGASMTNDASE